MPTSNDVKTTQNRGFLRQVCLDFEVITMSIENISAGISSNSVVDFSRTACHGSPFYNILVLKYRMVIEDQRQNNFNADTPQSAPPPAQTLNRRLRQLSTGHIRDRAHR